MIWYVALGRAVGGVSRYLLQGLVQRLTGTSFPSGTLAVNVSGSLVLGFILQYALESPAISPEVRALLTVGFCGGYTTFSTFSYETAALLEDGDYRRAALYITASVLDTEEKIEAILPQLDRMIGGGLITLEKVRVIVYRPEA